MGAMQVDRVEFLRLATLLFGIAGCGERAPAPAAPGTAASGERAGAPLENRTEPASSSGSPEAGCDNGRGTLRACARVSPTCEGLREECSSLAEDLVPRVAEQWAECFAAAKQACRPRSLGACMQAAVERACVEPGAADTCKMLMKACDAAGTPPRYTLEQCAKVVSTVKPDGPGHWKQIDEERMGPGAPKDACSLEHVLPYQPYGFMWR
jgi:hypothetical protein